MFQSTFWLVLICRAIALHHPSLTAHCENRDYDVVYSDWRAIMDCRDHMNLAVTPPDASNSQWRMAWFDPNNHNQQWRQDIEGRLINRGNGMAWKWDYYVNTFVDVNTDFSWSFNTCTRSTQEYSSSPIAQKLQVFMRIVASTQLTNFLSLGLN